MHSSRVVREGRNLTRGSLTLALTRTLTLTVTLTLTLTPPQDAISREEEEARLRATEAELSEAQGKELAGTLRASSVALSPFNTDAIARLNGMDPESPFVTQRPQSAYIWYKQGEGATERRNPGVPLASVDAGLSCAKYRTAAWLQANQPEWPPALAEYAEKYAAAVPQRAIVVPPKGAGLDRSQCSVLLSRPGVGDGC